MKWSGTALEARLKASLRKIFRYGRSGVGKNINTMKVPPIEENCQRNVSWTDPGGYLAKSKIDGHTVTADGSQNLPHHKDIGTAGTIQLNQQNNVPLRKPMKADAGVDTEKREICEHQDACNQVDFNNYGIYESIHHLGVIPDKHTSLNCPKQKLFEPTGPAIESSFTGQAISKRQIPQLVFSSTSCPHHVSEPLLTHDQHISNRPLNCKAACYLNSGDLYLGQGITSTATMDYPDTFERWSCEVRTSRYPAQQVLQSASYQCCLDDQQRVMNDHHHDVSAWNQTLNPDRYNCLTISTEDSQSVRSEERQAVSEACVPSIASDGLQNLKFNKGAKECGDACLSTGPIIATAKLKKYRKQSKRDHVTSDYSITLEKKKWLSSEGGPGRVMVMRRANFTQQRKGSVSMASRRIIRQSHKVERTLVTDSLEVGTGNVVKVVRRYKPDKQPGSVSNITKRKELPPSTTSFSNTNITGAAQTIHPNGAGQEKKMLNRKVEKSEHTSKNYASFPQSASDDGDASKLVRVGRPNEHSSASSIVGKVTRGKEVQQPPYKRQNSTSPLHQRKFSKHGGALPASSDLNQCPTGRHLDARADKPCICLLVKRMVLEQSKPVIYSWHIQQQKSIGGKHGQLTTAVRNTHAGTTEVENRFGSPVGNTAKSNAPTLSTFQLARPTRMVRGGQGTVAWVTNVTTGHFYALKFKQRDGRSDTTWAIERREAQLLKKSRHDFIVRLFHIYETEEMIFMALEWLDGGCLWNHIARAGTVPECYGIYYAACILTALRYLHRQFIVYRDMKAENVVLDHRGRPKLIDFGMAKHFGAPAKMDQGQESPPGEESYNDSEDFDQPPTRYYFAAYLAPEIYDSGTISELIDSWGLGYILVEMLLGYGIFLPMPWEKEPGQHLSKDWKLSLPKEAAVQLSPKCTEFVHKMLLRDPEERMSLAEAQTHPLFNKVPWTNLANMRGPDLTKCNPKSSAQSSSTGVLSGTKKWNGKQNSIVHIPDLAFVREFYGTEINPNTLYATQTLGTKRGKYAKVLTGKANEVLTDSKSLYQEIERGRGNAIDSTKRISSTAMGNGVDTKHIPAKTTQKQNVTKFGGNNRQD